MSVYFKPLWDTIEISAKLHKCSCSRMAINGGLDPTTFNRSKRTTNFGEHFISSGSLLKAFYGSKSNMLEFGVIFHVLYAFPNFKNTEQLQEIITDVNNTIQRHFENIKATTKTEIKSDDET